MNKRTPLHFFRTLLQTMTVFAALAIASCSPPDDNPQDPPGTVTVNMMNGKNGLTRLGNSDVSIDDANNFYSSICEMADLGRKSGLGSLPGPVLAGVGSRIAIKPGHGYQIFDRNALYEFPSGNIALNIESDYYNVYVVSYIKKDQAITGAVVKYVLVRAPSNGLPANNTNIGNFNNTGESISIELPDSGFEYDYTDYDSGNVVELTKDGNKLNIKFIEWKAPGGFGIYIRIKGAYTYVWGTIL